MIVYQCELCDRNYGPRDPGEFCPDCGGQVTYDEEEVDTEDARNPTRETRQREAAISRINRRQSRPSALPGISSEDLRAERKAANDNEEKAS